MASDPVRLLLSDAASLLAAAGIESPALDAEILLEHVSGIPRLRRRLGIDPAPPPEVIGTFLSLVRRRADRIPLQHLVGTAPFLELSLRVNTHVLVPRPETEQLALLARRRLPAGTRARVLDLGTGSGCLALALATHEPLLEVHAVDLSSQALEVARQNAEAIGVADRVRFHLRDAFGPDARLEDLGAFDLIVTNPPYIPSDEIPKLMPEVRGHDPHLALDGGPDGLAPYRTLAMRADRWLLPGGWILAEFGDDQEVELAQLFADAGWPEISIEKDLSGRDRILIVRASRCGRGRMNQGAAPEDDRKRFHHG